MRALVGMWRSLWRFHALLAAILIVEYALAFAIVLTAAGVLIARTQAISQTSGVDESGLYVLQARGLQQPVHRFELREAMQRFQAVVGAKHVAFGSSVPFFGRGRLIMPISVPGEATESPSLEVDGYEGGVRLAGVLGLRIVHGRGFDPDEVARRFGDTTRVVILSETLARRLFHGASALGKSVEIAGHEHTVIGVMPALAAPAYLGGQRTTYTFLLPKVTGTNDLILIRHDGPYEKLYATFAALRKHDAGRVNWSLWPYATLRDHYFQLDRQAVRALGLVVLVVLLTALCGILGLTNYWIARRRSQIAILRALGARKRDITVHFLGETSLLVALGLALGVILNFVFSSYLGVAHFEGGMAVWIISILLVFVLAIIVIHASLRRWLRLDAAELMRVP